MNFPVKAKVIIDYHPNLQLGEIITLIDSTFFDKYIVEETKNKMINYIHKDHYEIITNKQLEFDFV